LQGIANQAADLTFSEVPLAVVLMMNERRSEWAIPIWQQEKSRDRISFLAWITDANPVKPVLFHNLVSYEGPLGLRNPEPQEFAYLLA